MINQYEIHFIVMSLIGLNDPISAIKSEILKNHPQSDVKVWESKGLNIEIDGDLFRIDIIHLACWRSISQKLTKKCTNESLSEIARNINQHFPNDSVVVMQDGDESTAIIESGDIRVFFQNTNQTIFVDPKMLMPNRENRLIEESSEFHIPGF